MEVYVKPATTTSATSGGKLKRQSGRQRDARSTSSSLQRSSHPRSPKSSPRVVSRRQHRGVRRPTASPRQTAAKTTTAPRPTPLDHQKAAIVRLVAFESDQHGLLLSHEMGTGKTLTALLFFMNIAPGVRKLIVTRPVLRFVYNAEHQKVFGTPLPRDIEIITYDEIFAQIAKAAHADEKTAMAGAAVVFDEAHWINDGIARTAAGTNVVNLNPMSNLNTVKVFMTEPARALLMTGTPGELQTSEFQTLVAIAAGREVVPRNQNLFMKQFTTVNTWKSTIWGYLVPVVSKFAIFSTVMTYYLVPWISKVGYDRYVAMSLLVTKATYKISRGTSQSAAIDEIKPELESHIQSAVDNPPPPDEASGIVSKLWGNLKGKVQGVINWNAKMNFENNMNWSNFIALILFGVFFDSLDDIRREVTNNDPSNPMNYRDINIEKMTQAIAPFVSEYSVYDSKDNNNAFPSIVRRETIEVPYTDDQFEVLTRIRLNALRPKDIVGLGLSKTEAESVETSKMFNVDKTLVHSLMRRASQVPDAPGAPTLKMEYLLAEIVKDRRRPLRHIVYSDLPHVGARLYTFLKREGSKRRFTTEFITASHTPDRNRNVVERFSNGEFDVLLIDSGLTEGLNILRTRVFHIIDTPMSVNDIRQLEARAVRFNSHADVPESERKVEYQYYMASVPPNFAAAQSGLFSTFMSIDGIVRLVAGMVKSGGNVVKSIKALIPAFKIWTETDSWKSLFFSDYNNKNVVVPADKSIEEHVGHWLLLEIARRDKFREANALNEAPQRFTTTPTSVTAAAIAIEVCKFATSICEVCKVSITTTSICKISITIAVCKVSITTTSIFKISITIAVCKVSITTTSICEIIIADAFRKVTIAVCKVTAAFRKVSITAAAAIES